MSNNKKPVFEGNPYKEAAYSVYHNGCIELLDMLCMSNHPQEKIGAAVNMIVNMRSEIKARSEILSLKASKKNQPKISKITSKK